jgi:hypothetical protein
VLLRDAARVMEIPSGSVMDYLHGRLAKNSYNFSKTLNEDLFVSSPVDMCFGNMLLWTAGLLMWMSVVYVNPSYFPGCGNIWHFEKTGHSDHGRRTRWGLSMAAFCRGGRDFQGHLGRDRNVVTSVAHVLTQHLFSDTAFLTTKAGPNR